MEIINDKLTKCESYISRQKQYLLAMDNMSRDYIRDHAMVAQCHQEIADINRNIEFLNNQLNYLKTEKTILVREQAQDGTLPDSAYLEQVNVMGNSLTLRKLTDESLTIDRITFKIQEIEYKRNIDIRLKDGFDKLLKILSIGKESNDRKDLIEAKKNVENCQHRISLFDRALKRYININDINNLEYKQSHLIWKNPASRRPMTGNLSVKIQSAKNLFRLNNDELYVSVRVDGFTKQQTKPTKTDRWLEEFEMMVEKANELELIVYGTRSGNNPVPIGIFWIPIREIAEAVRTGAFNQGGWMNYNDTMKSEQGINIQQNIDNGNFVESWFTLEPIGQLELKLGFTKANRPLRTHSKLGRQGAVKKKKEQIIQHNGHNFVIKQFYNIMTCALCNEFLMRGSGFQCEDCGFFCHKKCGPQVLFKCISKTSGEVDAETINHHIPHRFEFTTNLSPNWCCHCGHLLPLGKKACKRCKSCSTMAHNECFHLVPDLCGLSMKEANGILTAIRRVKQDISNKSDHTIKGKSDSAIDQLAQGVNSLSTEARKTVIEDFHFLAVLGRGNFGKVMLSEEKSTKNLFAIKVLKKDLIIQSHDLDSLRAERRVFMTANKDHHPFLLGLHSCFQSPTRIYFVMEYIQGGDLMYHIQQQPFSVQQTKFYAIEVLLGLEHLHRNNIVYRDLKLDNILLDLDGHIRIADFGLCKEEMGYGSITHTFCGTPEFLAPEILLEQGYGRAVDWWAYGVLLYEMRLGSEPFKGSEEDEIYDAILEDEVLYPYNLERETVSILQKLLTRDPNYRLGGGPEDAQEVKRHIYFKGVVWDDYLNLKIPPPYKPTIRKKDDISNFESTFTNEQPVLTPTDSILSPQDQNEFSGFSYTANWAGERRN